METEKSKSIFPPILFGVAEGGEKTERELREEYDSLRYSTRVMVKFKDYCFLRSKYRYE